MGRAILGPRLLKHDVTVELSVRDPKQCSFAL